ncbi:hypothetical protein ABZ848_48485 [Streptomyces sp. NPDC047081]|uniref:hypothetical protein n=1 Tax=Streptomyces sp. NPDC047081 TaxID=3154706 RepID=UPI00340EB498
MRSTTRRLAAFTSTLAAALTLAVVGGSPAQASGQNCADNGDANVCINVNGASNVIHQIVGSAKTDRRFGFTNAAGVYVTYVGHVQVTDPNGKTLCNSSAQSLSGSGITLSCLWHGYGETYTTGDYCTTLWVYEYRGALFGWEYVKHGTECLNVFKS